MSATLHHPTSSQRMSLAEFHALPEDPSVDRMLLFGELVEQPMTKRNKWHGGSETEIAAILRNWCKSQTPRPGKVFSGEIGCDLPVVDTGVGIDVAFFDQQTLDAQDDDSNYIVGPPVLAVEILSLTDTVEGTHRKVKAYLEAGVKVIWVVDPYDHMLTVHRPSQPPRMFSAGQQLAGEPELPGLTVTISELFE